ncbi:hypothetical protein [Rickettsia hoogstraalii]|nr:hypothetical protein [Rickettsia hoogstraalii]
MLCDLEEIAWQLTKQSQDFGTRLPRRFAPRNDVEFYLHSLNIA